MKQLFIIILAIAAYSAQGFSQTNLAVGASITTRSGLGDPNLAIDNNASTYWYSDD